MTTRRTGMMRYSAVIAWRMKSRSRSVVGRGGALEGQGQGGSVLREALRRGGLEEHYGPVVADQTVVTILNKCRIPNHPADT